jgi:hypothetical protein
VATTILIFVTAVSVPFLMSVAVIAFFWVKHYARRITLDTCLAFINSAFLAQEKAVPRWKIISQ